MLLGICSDTHGRGLITRRAVALFDRLGVERIIHCGDVGGQAVFDELVGRSVRFVWGNTDSPDTGLLAYLQGVGIPAPDGVPLKLAWADRRIAVYHGHEPAFARAHRSTDVDYVLHGHTHVRRDDRMGAVRLINPGALHRARAKTVAMLDLATGALRFHVIDDSV